MNKIDLIIDALELASHVPKGVVYPAGYPMQIAQALAAARELRELKPTHYVDPKNERNIVHYDLWKSFDDCEILKERYTIPLYALDEVTK